MSKIEIINRTQATQLIPTAQEQIVISLLTPPLEGRREEDNIPLLNLEHLELALLDGYTEDYEEQDWGKLCCLEDIELIFSYVELWRGVETIYVCDDTNLERAWMLATGIFYYLEPEKRKEFVYVMTSRYKHISPRCLSIAELISIELESPDFLLEIEAYLVTQTAINRQGIFVKGTWN